MLKKVIAILLAVCCLLGTVSASAENTEQVRINEDDWITFLLMCNEGMQNDGANVGNTMMVVSMSPYSGRIRLMMFTWDTFVNYEGYDIPQLIDQPYRNNGPEETMKVFNENFDTDIGLFMSLNYLNLAGLIDSYGGVDVDISRAERNALNGMVTSKKENIKAMADSGLLSQMFVEMLADEYYLNEYGPETHLNGLQAVGYGWLQYDSVYNCCQREIRVIGNLFHSVGKAVENKVVFYTDASGLPEGQGGKRAINLDNVTEDDMDFLRREVDPIFTMSYNNLSEDEIAIISLALVNAAYQASRQGVNIFDMMEYAILPLEATQPYEVVAGTSGHVIDVPANIAAIKEFLFRAEE